MPLIQFTSCTFDRLKERRNEWLHLDGEQREIAEKSLEFLTIEQEQLCYENDSPPFFYHKECYRRFTIKLKWKEQRLGLKRWTLNTTSK